MKEECLISLRHQNCIIILYIYIYSIYINDSTIMIYQIHDEKRQVMPVVLSIWCNRYQELLASIFPSGEPLKIIFQPQGLPDLVFYV